MAKWLVVPVLVLAAAAAVPAKPAPGFDTVLKGPKVWVLAASRGGLASSVPYEFSGFGPTPVVDVTCSADTVSVRDLVVTPGADGSGTFRFTLAYAANAPKNFEIHLAVTGGTGMASGGWERLRVEVRRAD